MTIVGPDLAFGRFATVVAGIGDVNADGYADVMILRGSSTEMALGYMGTPRGLDLAPQPVGVVGAPVFSIAGAGDVNGDNTVDITDFNLLRAGFAKTCGDPAYNPLADFTGDCLVDISDFNLLRGNFGQAGPPVP